MRTPIADFVKEYAEKKVNRFHMPGHKGRAFLGCEPWDITEIAGADALYEASGVIAESEANAAKLFGSAKTVYSTEGSSQCIRAMMHLAVGYQKQQWSKRPYVIAARNAHKAFLYAAALIDFDVVWLEAEEMHSLCCCEISPKQLREELKRQIRIHEGVLPAAVYITSPDYLGGSADIGSIAQICHEYGTILTVDNAHGAYLHFLETPRHPMDLGADLCCDSAHKTLPVLTGGAYLQIGKQAPSYFTVHAKQAMALYGSSSPSYLTMSSLDLCNAYLAKEYKEKLAKTIKVLEEKKALLRKKQWDIAQGEPLKLTIRVSETTTGDRLAAFLRTEAIECEYADEEFVVFMVTPENSEEALETLCEALEKFPEKSFVKREKTVIAPVRCEQKRTIRDAVFAEQELVRAEDSPGRICGTPTVGCPPAIPIVSAGELINERAAELFVHYGVAFVSVLK